MPGPLIAAAAIGTAGAVYGANKQASAAAAAGDQVAASNAAAIAEQRRQFQVMRKLMKPYVNSGKKGLTGMMNLSGMNGRKAQQKSINGVERSAEFKTLLANGEEAILANAAATGGLRGGNTQAALMEYRPELLNSLINQKYQRLSGIATMGQNSAAGVGTNAMNMANNIGQIQQGTGQALGQSTLAQGQAWSNLAGDIAGVGGTLAGQWQPGVPNGGLF